MPDFRKTKLSMIRHSKEAIPITDEVTHYKDIRRQKGQTGAQEVINEIYEMKLFQLLNESAKGLSGGRGRRAAERREVKKQAIIASALA